MTEQQDLAQAFLQNQARASGLRDTSILPDLCAKEELSVNLHTRLKWVMYIQVMTTMMMIMTSDHLL